MGGLAGQECLVTGCDALVCGWLCRFEPCCAQRGPSIAQLRVPGQAELCWPCPGLAAGRDTELLLAGAWMQSHGVWTILLWDSPLGPHLPAWCGRAGARNCPATCPCALSLKLYNWVLQGVSVPWGLLCNCLRNASKDLDCRLQFLRLS